MHYKNNIKIEIMKINALIICFGNSFFCKLKENYVNLKKTKMNKE